MQCKLIFPSAFAILLLYELTNQLTDLRLRRFHERQENKKGEERILLRRMLGKHVVRKV